MPNEMKHKFIVYQCPHCDYLFSQKAYEDLTGDIDTCPRCGRPKANFKRKEFGRLRIKK